MQPQWADSVHSPPHRAPFPAVFSLCRARDDRSYAALLKDQRTSISMRSQAYASMAVVAALIAGISVTFVVEIDVHPLDADGNPDPFQTKLLQGCAVGTLMVCFMSLYGTMVLSMQYYLVTR